MIKNLHKKEITELKQNELIEIFLSESTEPFQLKYDLLRTTFSVLMEGINETFNKKNTKDILPIMGMFSVLDILGSAFSLKDTESKETVPIKKCLESFSTGLTKKDKDSLYALRNSLMHNASLISIPKPKKQNYYYFIYNNNNDKLVTHPKEKWDGDYKRLDKDSEKYITEINTKFLLELIKLCTTNIKNLSKESNIVLNYKKGKREFFYRYFRLYQNKLNEKTIEKIKEKALSPEIKGNIDRILESTNNINEFVFLHLGTSDEYIDTSYKEKHIIYAHESNLITQEMKNILSRNYHSHRKHRRELSSFYKTDIHPSAKYKIELWVK